MANTQSLTPLNNEEDEEDEEGESIVSTEIIQILQYNRVSSNSTIHNSTHGIYSTLSINIVQLHDIDTQDC